MNKTELIATITEAHREVREFRAEMELYFPPPPRDDSLAFAVTEVGEAVLAAAVVNATQAADAVLRANPIYKRNNTDKRHSETGELAQCAMMLLSAIPGTRLDLGGLPTIDKPWALSRIVQYVAAAWVQSTDRSILYAVAAIASRIELLPCLRFELSLLRQKHRPADNGPASQGEVTNEHNTGEGMNFHIWQTEEPGQYSADDAGEWVRV